MSSRMTGRQSRAGPRSCQACLQLRLLLWPGIVSGIGGTHQVAENRARALERKRLCLEMPCLVRFVGSEATTRQREAAVEEAQEEAMAAQAAQAQAEPDFEARKA